MFALYFGTISPLRMRLGRYVSILLALFASAAFAQDRFVEERVNEARQRGEAFAPLRLFERMSRTSETTALWTDALREATVLRFDAAAAARLLAAPQERIALELPGPNGTEVIDLVRADIFAAGFQVSLSSGGRAEVELGLHYRGVVRNVPGTLAAISIFPDQVMGLIGGADGSRVLGPLEGDADRRHVLYNDRDLHEQRGHACGTLEAPGTLLEEDYRPRAGMKTIRCVNIYWESAHDLYLNKGSSVANVTTYLTGLFNQMSTIYNNDGVQVQLSEIFVWNTPSPYDATSSSGRLNQFGTVRTSFNGNLAHLIDLGNYGGVAWLNTICSSTNLRMAYSGINANYSNVPAYSWSVMVVTHETGHNLGSPHTHNCSWNGNNTAIDGCGPTAGYTEGSCANAGLPSGGGTVMSYCHLIGGTGINLAMGFGPQPKALIINRVNSASCLAQCGTSCDPPLPLNVSSITAISATLSWASFGLGNYTLRWKPTSSGTWTVITGLTGTTYNLTGLTQDTEYEFQVLSVCGGSSSAYSTSRVFTTPVVCTDPYEPNNGTGAATAITLPASINALISPANDNDYFSFTVSATSTINLSLTNLPANFNLRLLNSGGSQLAISQNGGTTNENINYTNAAAGTYYAQVLPSGSANNGSVCYLLTVSSFVTQCNVPQGLSSNSITYNSAQINWISVQGASSYDLRWKPSASPTWTDVFGIATNTYPLTGLSQQTAYDVQVRANCGGAGSQGGSSSYTSTHTFTTLQAPCEVIPRSVVAAKVFLEGPYKTANGLMADSLRKLNLIPFTEPYTALGHAVTGPTMFSPGLLAITGANAIVDWVLVELRQNNSPYTVLEARAGLLQRDGDIVATDGSSPLGFCPDAGTYRVAVRHRNHLGVMSGAGIALSSSATVVNFTLSGTSTYGTNALKGIGSVMALWAGNVWLDNALRYTGEQNDRDPILTMVGGSVPTATAFGYHAADVNLDGTVKYTGEGNDRDPILTNIGGSVPTNTRTEQLP